MIHVVAQEYSDRNHSPVHTSMTSGALYNLSLVRNEQGFREDFFIDFVDHEYHMKLSTKGHQLFWIHHARVLHQLGKTKTNAAGQVLNYHNPWRYYFIRRNMFTCYYEWGGLQAVWRLWRVSKRQFVSYKSLEGVDYKLIWKYFNLGVRDSFLRRLFKMKTPKTIKLSIQ